MEALDSLLVSIPDWHVLLDNLNGTISSRQHELAQLDDYQPPTRSLRNKGSTESLRPKDLTESPIHEDGDMTVPTPVSSNPAFAVKESSEIPTSSILGNPSTLTPAKSTTVPPPLLSHSSSPGPAVLQRRTSNRIASALKPSPNSPPFIRKRKTASIASNDSRAPKYRTRSMIIVYYDSAVQIAFEELVKFISASRNAMRKGKMAARMTAMRKMADLEMDSSDDEESKDNSPPILDKRLPSYMNIAGNGHAITVQKDLKDAVDGDGDSDMEMPKLQFISTRRMGPSRDQVVQRQLPAPTSGATALPPIPGLLRPTGNWRTSGLVSGPASGPASIFDELDTGLEWCQSMCERAAHQFLRDGDCNIEIEGIKRRLNEVKEAVEKQLAINAEEEANKLKVKADGNKSSRTKTPERPRGETYDGTPALPVERRSLRAIQMRRTPSMGVSTEPEIPNAMEVDDEGFGDDDEEELPKLVWRSARDY